MAPDALDPFNLRRRIARLNGIRSLPGDLSLLLNAREALLPLPFVDRHKPVSASDLFPRRSSRPIASLSEKRIGVVGSGGGGACVAMVGVARAFEEAGIRPASISACSGSALWGAMWAAGLTAQEMAEFSLSWRPQDYLDIQWTKLPRFALSAMRGFTGIAKSEALEQLFDRRLWHMSAGETEIPLHTVVYNIDRGRVEYFGSYETPDLTLGEVARIAVAQPFVVEAVRVEGDLYVDGGVVDGFPAEPLETDGTLDQVFGINVLLPPGLEGEQISGWESRSTGVLDASRQLRVANQLELARRSRRRLGDKLTLIEPVDYRELRGAAFYDLFLDRGRWPRLMRQGYDAAVEALRPFRRRSVNSRSRAADKGRGNSAR